MRCTVVRAATVAATERSQETNLDNCRRNLDTNKKDMDMIKDCITTTEVSMARVYNHDVKTRAAAR